MLTSSTVRGIHLINKSYVTVINKITVASCLKVSKKSFLFLIFTPYTFLIVIIIVIEPVSEFIVSLTNILHNTYLT